MTRESLIQKTVAILSKLPENKVHEIADYADFLLKKFDEEILQHGIHTLVSDSKSFTYLKNEEELYTVNDLKERYK